MLKNSFHKQERLCSRKAIDQLFLKGLSFNSSPVKMMLIKTTLDTGFPGQAMFVVPKKKFKLSPDRNLLKRRMREAYRLNKGGFYEALNQNGLNVQFAFIYTQSKALEYGAIEKAIQTLLSQSVNKIKSTS